MTSVANASAGRNQLGAALKAGVDTLSQNQTIIFDLYLRVVLPLDGYVFWVKAEIAGASALLNASPLNTWTLNQPEEAGDGLTINGRRKQIQVMGSLHYSSDSRQEEEANYTANRVMFTSEKEVNDFNAIGPDFLYIATFDGIQFAFSSRSSYYKQAELWHLIGDAVYSTMRTQIVEDARLLNTQQLIVSNSLPAWLNFASVPRDYPTVVPRPRVPFFPSFLVLDNFVPPFVSVHIEPTMTLGLQTAPALSSNASGQQLAQDRVTLTLYGCNNQVAQDLLRSILQYSFDENIIGLLNIPVIQDLKQGQSELSTLAMKKRIVFDVSYNQAAVRDAARQLILEAIPTYIIGDTPISQES